MQQQRRRQLAAAAWQVGVVAPVLLGLQRPGVESGEAGGGPGVQGCQGRGGGGRGVLLAEGLGHVAGLRRGWGKEEGIGGHAGGMGRVMYVTGSK